MSITVDRIFELAMSNGVTAEFLNDLIGGYYGKTKGWKTGRIAPTFSEINTIANYFNVSLDYLLGNTFDPEPSSAKNAILPSRETARAAAEGSYLYIAETDGPGRRIPVPADKVGRLLMLLEAGFPELMNNTP